MSIFTKWIGLEEESVTQSNMDYSNLMKSGAGQTLAPPIVEEKTVI
jgi:hypothetical protein